MTNFSSKNIIIIILILIFIFSISLNAQTTATYETMQVKKTVTPKPTIQQVKKTPTPTPTLPLVCNGEKCERVISKYGALCGGKEDKPCSEIRHCLKGKCEVGAGAGMGVQCGSDLDCQFTACSHADGGTCLLGGVGKKCDPEAVPSDCQDMSSRYCYYDPPNSDPIQLLGARCVAAKDANTSISCKDDSGCGSVCTVDYDNGGWKCGGKANSLTPTSVPCGVNQDCEILPTVCVNNQCTPAIAQRCDNSEICNLRHCTYTHNSLGGTTGAFCDTTKRGPQYRSCTDKSDCTINTGSPRQTAGAESNTTNTMANYSIDVNMIAKMSKMTSGKLPSAKVGSDDALVKLTVFQDLKCGMAKKAFLQSIPKIIDQFVATNKVQIVFFEFPLLDNNEAEFSKSAICAAKQNKYLDYVKYLFENIKTTQVSEINVYAKNVGLDVMKFSECMSNPNTAKHLAEQKSFGKEIGVNGTPTFFLNGIEIGGARDPEDMANIIQDGIDRISVQ